MTAPGTLEAVLQTLGRVLQPLGAALGAQDDARELLAELGLELPPEFWQRPAMLVVVGDAAAAVDDLPNRLTALADAIDGDDTVAIITAAAELADDIRAVFVAIDGIATELGEAASSNDNLEPADLDAFLAEFPDRLLGYLAVNYFESEHRGVLAALYALGIAERSVERADSTDPNRPAAYRYQLRFDRLPDLLSSPTGLFASVYGWGDVLDADRIMLGLEGLLDAVGTLAVLDEGGAHPTVRTVGAEIRHRTDINPNPIEAEFRFGAGGATTRVVDLGGGWSVAVNSDAGIDAGAVLTLAPPLEVSIEPTALPVQGAASAELVRTNGPGGDPILLLGLAGGPRFEAEAFVVRFAADLRWDADNGRAAANVEVGLKLRGGRIVITLDDADGFVNSLLGDGLVIQAEIEAGWSLQQGIFFRGGTGIAVDVPVDVHFGNLRISTLHLALGFVDEAIRLEASGTIGARLGPLAVAVERMGVLASLAFPASGGNLEVADLSFAFRPASGLGLTLDAGPVSGGGFIAFDPARGRYSGALKLKIASVSVTALGILDTRGLDGSDLPAPGFTLLIVISAEFPAIQVGFGFTLSGIGGLIGVHRRSDYDALRAGLTTGALDSVMFPPDPVANADQVVRDLTTLFPQQDDRYIVGPMFLLGWAAIIRIEVGVLIILGGPAKIQLLGQLSTELPNSAVPLIKLHIDVIGELDFSQGTLKIDAALRDSSLVGFPLTGDMAVRVRWKQAPMFGVSFGGFHPDYRPEAAFPTNMRRLALSIANGSNFRLSAEAYLAVTSNSLQFGVRAELYAGAAGFSVTGLFEVNMLIVLSPFGFSAGVRFEAALRFKGMTFASIGLVFELSGPRPWRAKGHLRIKIVFVTFKLGFNVSWGSSTPIALPAKSVWPDLKRALQDPDSWTAFLPSEEALDVLLLPRDPIDGPVVHPHGRLELRQRVLPFDIAIERFGSARPQGHNLFLTPLISAADKTLLSTPVEDDFAAGQFLDLTEDEKLSRPSFERLHAGVLVGSDAVSVGMRSLPDTDYETRIVPPEGDKRLPFALEPFALVGAQAQFMNELSAAPELRSSTAVASRYTQLGRTSAIAVRRERVFVRDGISGSTGRSSSSSWAQARQALQRYREARPTLNASSWTRFTLVGDSEVP